MSKNTFDTIVSVRELPWHKDAIVPMEDTGAVEATGMTSTPFYEKRPMTVMLNGEVTETGDYCIVRSATPADPKEMPMGIVGKGYQILQPIDICEQFDINVGKSIETFGFLGKGDRVFLTWRVPSFDVRGDVIDLYGFVAGGYDGKFGVSLNLVSVRVVCQNTFNMAVNEARSNVISSRGIIWTGKHNSKNLARDLGIWMAHIDPSIERQRESASYIFNQMAGIHIASQQQVDQILNNVYPDPKPLPDDFPARLREEKQAVIDKKAEEQEWARTRVSWLFDGNGTAIDATAWGLFNAITEHENFRPTRKSAHESILFGNRANNMMHGLGEIVNFFNIPASKGLAEM